MPRKRTSEVVSDVSVDSAAAAAAPAKKPRAPRAKSPARAPKAASRVARKTPVEPEQASPAVEEKIEALTAAAPAPDREEIARLAYSYWEARGRHGGSPEEDWRRAEDEIRRRRAGNGAA